MDQAQQEFQVALDMARRGRELWAGEADPVQLQGVAGRL